MKDIHHYTLIVCTQGDQCDRWFCGITTSRLRKRFVWYVSLRQTAWQCFVLKCLDMWQQASKNLKDYIILLNMYLNQDVIPNNVIFLLLVAGNNDNPRWPLRKQTHHCTWAYNACKPRKSKQIAQANIIQSLCKPKTTRHRHAMQTSIAHDQQTNHANKYNLILR